MRRQREDEETEKRAAISLLTLSVCLSCSIGDHLLIAKKTCKDLEMGDRSHPNWPNIQGYGEKERDRAHRDRDRDRERQREPERERERVPRVADCITLFSPDHLPTLDAKGKPP